MLETIIQTQARTVFSSPKLHKVAAASLSAQYCIYEADLPPRTQQKKTQRQHVFYIYTGCGEEMETAKEKNYGHKKHLQKCSFERTHIVGRMGRNFHVHI